MRDLSCNSETGRSPRHPLSDHWKYRDDDLLDGEQLDQQANHTSDLVTNQGAERNTDDAVRRYDGACGRDRGVTPRHARRRCRIAARDAFDDTVVRGSAAGWRAQARR
jgi:hypothetical protein